MKDPLLRRLEDFLRTASYGADYPQAEAYDLIAYSLDTITKLVEQNQKLMSFLKTQYGFLEEHQ